jgi:hypothetical protein
MNKQDIRLRFPVVRKKQEKALRDRYLELALFLGEQSIDSREQTIAMERLEESFMWGLKGLFLDED